MPSTEAKLSKMCAENADQLTLKDLKLVTNSSSHLTVGEVLNGQYSGKGRVQLTGVLGAEEEAQTPFRTSQHLETE